MSEAVSVSLSCGCIATADAGAAKVTPVCPEHVADVQALALLMSQNAAVKALLAASDAPGVPGGFSYSGSPASNAKDRVRFTIADTKDPAMFTDGEIEAMLQDARGDWLTASLWLLDALIARFSGACDETVGSVSMSFSQKADGYRKLADTLRARLGRRALPFCGGISRRDKWMRAVSPDRVQPTFRRGMFGSVQRIGETLYLSGAATGDFYLHAGTTPYAGPNF